MNLYIQLHWFGVESLKVLCDLLFHWELDGCNLPLRGRRLRAQVCGVVNILQGWELLHTNREISLRHTSYHPLHPSYLRCNHPVIIITTVAYWEDRATPYQNHIIREGLENISPSRRGKIPSCVPFSCGAAFVTPSPHSVRCACSQP